MRHSAGGAGLPYDSGAPKVLLGCHAGETLTANEVVDGVAGEESGTLELLYKSVGLAAFADSLKEIFFSAEHI